MMMSVCMTPAQVALRAGCGERTVIRHCERGLIEGAEKTGLHAIAHQRRDGRQQVWRIPRAAGLAWARGYARRMTRGKGAGR
jgi:hypothetical protein